MNTAMADLNSKLSQQLGDDQKHVAITRRYRAKYRSYVYIGIGSGFQAFCCRFSSSNDGTIQPLQR